MAAAGGICRAGIGVPGLLCGVLSEKYWLLVDIGDNWIEVPAYLLTKRRLLREFEKQLPGFNSALTGRVMISKEENSWVCWER